MLKKYVEIRFQNKVIGVATIKEAEPTEFLKIEQEAKKNLAALTFGYNQEIEGLKKEITDLKKEIKFLKGED